MIQFLGLAFSEDEVRVASLGRDLCGTVRASTRIANVHTDESGGPSREGRRHSRVVPAEWVRAAGFALGEAYVAMPPKERKIWGIGLTGPAGWIALDLDFTPLADLRLVPARDVLADFSSWLEAHPRLRNRIGTVLSPKDYFRFVISRGLATDVTTVSAINACSDDSCDWNVDALAAQSIERTWLPPVFDSTATPGRLDEEGMRQTGLPGSLWIVAGGLPDACRGIDAGNLERGVLWTPTGNEPPTFGLGDTPFGTSATRTAPQGWRLVRAPIRGHAHLVREDYIDNDGARRELEKWGHTVESTIENPGTAELGAAAVAAVGSNLVRSWDWFYRRR